MAEKTSTDDGALYRAYKFRLDPNQAQKDKLMQCVGAARYTYNLFTDHNRKVSRARAEYVDTRISEGATEATAKAELDDIKEENPAYKYIGHFEYGKRYLTPERQRHEAIAQAIADGADPAVVWPETERSSEPWMHTIDRRVLVSGIKNAHVAWGNYFESLKGLRAGPRMGVPRFKRKGISHDSFTVDRDPRKNEVGAYGTPYKKGTPEYARRTAQLKRRGIKATPTIEDYRHVRLSHLGVIRTHNTTKPLVKAVRAGANVKSYTVSRAANRWYVSVLVKLSRTSATPTHAQRSAGAVGVDLGVRYLAVLSDEQAPQRFARYPSLGFTGDGAPTLANPRWARAAEKRLVRLQRALARAQKGSNRRARLVQQIARHHHLVALRRESGLHQVSKRLSTGYTLIGLEDLAVAGMTASATGTVEAPGKNVRQKAGLNRSILDAAFSTLRRQLEYKASWYGSQVQIIDRFFASSQTCSACGARAKTKLDLRVRVFECAACGVRIDRDVNAARNIRAEAVRMYEAQLAPGTGESLNGRGATDSDAAGSVALGDAALDASRPAATGGGSP
ncbi:RNA-guided endonuclease TnpB family protein [Rothia mucilaginosa]|uniref:Transposase n=1 Tax=Rothia mucilaginosa TaxID=43675 RepID=A0A943TAW3_9MICC|nr:RNA-guided endonuclease TnpB family protein [Rothia mucilaginosa]MBS6634275.1 transposase [Rothia mucilaginosa]